MSEVKASTAVGHIPSGLFIICGYDEETKKADGFLGSFVQQVSMDPLLICLAVKPGRPSADHILAKKRFTVNVVGDHEKNYLKHFWKGYDPESNPFDEINHRLTENNDVLMLDARSTIIAEAVEIYSPGDHQLVVARVIDSVVHSESAKSATHQRKDGLSY